MDFCKYIGIKYVVNIYFYIIIIAESKNSNNLWNLQSL